MRVGVTPTVFGAVRGWPAWGLSDTVTLIGPQSRIAMRHVANEARWVALLVGVAGLLVAGGAPAGSEIFRCVESGRVTYADRQCGESSVVVARSGYAMVSAVDRVSPPATPVELGMSPRMVQQAMGRPRETVATLQGNSLVEYWIWRHAGNTTRVAFREGRVSDVVVR